MAIDSGKLAHWSKQFAAWRASGLSRSKFCQKEAIKLGTFDYWRAQLIAVGRWADDSAKKPVKANAITLIEAERERPQQASKPTPIKLKTEAWELSLPEGVDAQWLSALLRALS